MTRVGVVQLNAPNAAYKTNLKTKEPWGARCRGVLQYAPNQLMSGLGVTLVAHTHLKGSVWSTSLVIPLL
jgi:hypothetical protein